jgi:hypothetical protein
MNKDLYNVLEATQLSLNGKLDADSQKYIEREILERKLDGSGYNIQNIQNGLK